MPTMRNGSGGSNSDLLRRKFPEYLSLMGRNDITLNTATETTDADGKITAYSTSSSTVTGDLQFVTFQDKQLLEMGVVNVGDGIIYFLYSTSAKDFDIVVVDSVTWELVKQLEAETVEGNLVYQGWACKRKH